MRWEQQMNRSASLGISEYELSHFLPTTEEIEQVLSDTGENQNKE